MADMGEPARRTSPWVWVAVGCAGIVLLAFAGLAVVGYFAYNKVKDIEAEMKDPQARTATVQRILGADALPDEYYAVIGMSVPLVMEMAVLSDQPPEFDDQGRKRPGSGMGRRGFIYVRTLAGGNQDRQEIRDYFEGRTDDTEVLRRNNIRLQRQGEVLKRGVLDLSRELKVMYMAQRGQLDMAASRAHGISTVMLLECEGDSRQRFGIWFGPDAEGDDLAGTPADESAIREFMGHFRPCGRAG